MACVNSQIDAHRRWIVIGLKINKLVGKETPRHSYCRGGKRPA